MKSSPIKRFLMKKERKLVLHFLKNPGIREALTDMCFKVQQEQKEEWQNELRAAWKSELRAELKQELREELRAETGEASSPAAPPARVEPDFSHRDTLPGKMIAVRGFYYSGSSALTGLFCEFDNMFTAGNTDDQFSKAGSKTGMSEVVFFVASKFCEMVNSFRAGLPAVSDVYIKHFVTAFSSAKKHKATRPWEYQPLLYNDYFVRVTEEFLDAILDLDDYTREKMRGADFPTMCSKADQGMYEGCSFLKKNPSGSCYIFYRFKEMSGEAFDAIVARYLRQFFSILGDQDIVVYDQALHNDYLETVNYFLKDSPIKQICIYRDPRDQYISLVRQAVLYFPADPDKFEQLYRKGIHLDLLYCGLEHALENPNPHRLLIRFEDLVVKYDETVQRILDFIGVDRSHHVNPRGVFDPAISVVNVGAHKTFEDQELMKELERRMAPYCYYPEKEHLSPESWDLLESSGNWKRPAPENH